MDIKKMTKEELELLSHKDISFYILEKSEKSINTADLFKQIIELLELPKSYFDKQIGDYYTSLATDKRFILLEDGTWDLKSRHSSDKVAKFVDDEDEEDEEEEQKEDIPEEIEEDNYDDTDDVNYDNTDEEDLKDLVIIDEDELELEE